jgi:hypothetical protein
MAAEMEKDSEGSGPVLIEVLSEHLAWVTEEITTHLSEDSKCPGRDSIRTLLAYIVATSSCSVTSYGKKENDT